LFIVDENWKIRRFLLPIIMPTENLVLIKDAVKNPMEFGIKNLGAS
jgi:hypothetical protein